MKARETVQKMHCLYNIDFSVDKMKRSYVLSASYMHKQELWWWCKTSAVIHGLKSIAKAIFKSIFTAYSIYGSYFRPHLTSTTLHPAKYESSLFRPMILCVKRAMNMLFLESLWLTWCYSVWSHAHNIERNPPPISLYGSSNKMK